SRKEREVPDPSSKDLKPDEKKAGAGNDVDKEPKSKDKSPADAGAKAGVVEEPKQKNEKEDKSPTEEAAGKVEKTKEEKSLVQPSIDGMNLVLNQHGDTFNFTFLLTMGAQDQGLYNLNFHYCSNSRPGAVKPYSLS
ncbi:hypothetical protein C0J50_12785, partial [Silurus asotus]